MPDPQYQTIPYRFANRGLVARYVGDAPPEEGCYLDMLNLESRQEGSLTNRLGQSLVTYDPASKTNTPILGTIVSLGGMLGLEGNKWRYAITGRGFNPGGLFRRAGNDPGAYSQIASGFDGPDSILQYRPTLSSIPYSFFADPAIMLKDNGTLAQAQKWGIDPPRIPIIVTQSSPGGLTTAAQGGHAAAIQTAGSGVPWAGANNALLQDGVTANASLNSATSDFLVAGG